MQLPEFHRYFKSSKSLRKTEEYFQIISDSSKNKKRIDEILIERKENSKIVGRLLEQLET